jgi:GNAT superfamily N-acetyltransferase
MNPTFRPATAADADALLELMRLFYESSRLWFHPERARSALFGLLADPSLGRAWLIEADGETVGYAVLILSYSLEFHGRIGALDELFVREDYRGRGVGGRAVRFVEEHCRALGLPALTLEVDRDDARAQAVYSKAGLLDANNFLLFKRLTDV